jgi:hypothetical protein
MWDLIWRCEAADAIDSDEAAELEEARKKTAQGNSV